FAQAAQILRDSSTDGHRYESGGGGWFGAAAWIGGGRLHARRSGLQTAAGSVSWLCGQRTFSGGALATRLCGGGPPEVGGESASPVGGAASVAGAGVYVAAVLSPGEAGAGDSAGARADTSAGGVFEPEPDRGRARGGAERGPDTGAVCAAGGGVERGPLYAGAGRGGQWAGVLAFGKRGRAWPNQRLAGVH